MGFLEQFEDRKSQQAGWPDPQRDLTMDTQVIALASLAEDLNKSAPGFTFSVSVPDSADKYVVNLNVKNEKEGLDETYRLELLSTDTTNTAGEAVNRSGLKVVGKVGEEGSYDDILTNPNSRKVFDFTLPSGKTEANGQEFIGTESFTNLLAASLALEAQENKYQNHLEAKIESVAAKVDTPSGP